MNRRLIYCIILLCIIGMAYRNSLVLRAKRWGNPLRNIIVDYIEVSKDIVLGMKKSPVKGIMWLLLGGVIHTSYRKCPDFSSYQNEMVEYCNEFGLCAKTSVNLQKKNYIDDLSTQLYDGCIEYVNLGVLSLIIRRSQSTHCYNYHARCKHLKPRVWKLYHSIVDVGFWNQWLVLRRTMIDFDINENEFS